MNQRVGELDKSVQEANDPTRLAQQKKLLDLSNKSLAQFDNHDYDAAIATCKAILKEFGDQPVIKKRLGEWEAGWALKNSDHGVAREFVYREWPAVKSSADIEAKIPLARQKMQVLIGVKDEYTLAKLRDTLPDVAKVLRDEIQVANQNPDDGDKLTKLKKVADDFDKFAR